MCFIARRPALHRPSLFLLTSAGAASRTENLHLALFAHLGGVTLDYTPSPRCPNAESLE